MGELTDHERAVAENYDGPTFEYETDRLPVHQPVELAITSRHLERFVSADAVVVLEAGVGVGHYSELLARRGCSLHLVDVAQRLLDAATARLKAAGLGDYIIDAMRTSATQLSHVATGSCDAVMSLGPLYHLPESDDRNHRCGESSTFQIGRAHAPPRRPQRRSRL